MLAVFLPAKLIAENGTIEFVERNEGRKLGKNVP